MKTQKKEIFENNKTIRNNKLINARIKLNAKAYDLTRSFISLIEKNDTDFYTYALSTKNLNIDYKEAKDIIKNIMKNPVEIADDSKKKFESFSWFVTMKYNKGLIEAKINPDLKDMMLQMKGNFTKIFEKYILPMKSMYAKRLYELLVEYKGIGFRKFSLKDLQEKLYVSKSLERYSIFKIKVLAIAIRDINKHTDIYIDVPLNDFSSEKWTKLQCGKNRGISHLNFVISQNEKNVDNDKIILDWVNKVRKSYINKQLIRYQNKKYNGFLSVNAKGRLYLQDKLGNSFGIDINNDKSWELWKWLYNNKENSFILG